jgi:hypothetical protein
MICPFCGNLIEDVGNTDNYVEVRSWVNGPKLDGPKLREQTGRVAHKHCVENLAHGQAVDQPEIFDDVAPPNPGVYSKKSERQPRSESLCDAPAKKGTGLGICNTQLTKQGDCPNGANHIGME